MYKLYTPKTATAETPAPGVLLLHGYQNDHETCAAYAIKLARRGAVVLCLDEYGHGSTTAGLINRGYVNHKVTVNYGEDSVEDGTFKTIGGQTRYKVMMNFSNLSFFDKHYTTDADGNSMKDSSAGGSYAYALLAAMDQCRSRASCDQRPPDGHLVLVVGRREFLRHGHRTEGRRLAVR